MAEPEGGDRAAADRVVFLSPDTEDALSATLKEQVQQARAFLGVLSTAGASGAFVAMGLT